MRKGRVLFVMVAVLAMAGAASAQTLLIPAKYITPSHPDCTAEANPVKCTDFDGTSFGANDIRKRWVFAEATVWVQCGENPSAQLVDEFGNIAIVDNFMTVNDDLVSVCTGGNPSFTPVPGIISNTNCFSTGFSNITGVPIETRFTPPGATDINVVEGINQLNVRLWDWGSVYGNTAIYLDTDCNVCDELIIDSETAWAFGDRYVSRGNWATYTKYFAEPLTVDLFAGKTMFAGIVKFSAPVDGLVTITIELEPTWRFAEGYEENLHIQWYFGGVPGENPAPGLFDYKSIESSEFGGTATAVVPEADFYGIHAALEHVVGCVTREKICADFTTFEPGESVEGFGAVLEGLEIDTPNDEAVAIFEGVGPIAYGAPNNGSCGGSGFPPNGCIDVTGGFSNRVFSSDGTLAAHSYTFTFEDPISEFSLHMLDYGDLNPSAVADHLVTMTAFDASYLSVDTQTLSYTAAPEQNPRSSEIYGDMVCPVTYPGGSGDACSAEPGEPGNYQWMVEGDGITKVELAFGSGYDPKIGFDNLCITRYVTYYVD